MWAQLLSQHSRGDGRKKSSRNRPGVGVHTYNLNTRRKMQEDLWEFQASQGCILRGLLTPRLCEPPWIPRGLSLPLGIWASHRHSAHCF